nr:hypothetical protein [uncultured Sphingomonas sp.]
MLLMTMALPIGPEHSDAARREVARQECRLKETAETITFLGAASSGAATRSPTSLPP